MISLSYAEEGTDPTATGGPCHPFPSAHYRRAIGYGTGREATAIRQAREEARRSLLEQTTAGFSDVRRDAVATHIGNAGAHYNNRQACAAADVEQRVLNAFEEDAEQYERDVAALAAAATEKSGGLLQLERPTWADSGCTASIGATLSTALRDKLGAQDVQLVARGSSHPTAPRLRLELAAHAQGVRLSPALLDPVAGIETPLPGFSFPLDLFNTTVDEVGTCASDADLGLQHGSLSGKVDISLDVLTQDGFLCEGDQLEPVLHSETPVYAQVFSVYSDEAVLVWSGPVSGEASLGDMTVLRLNEQDEKLVVVAAKNQRAMRTMGTLPLYCRLEDGLRPEMYPRRAAVDSETYTIHPAGTHSCDMREDLETSTQQAQEWLSTLQPCP